MEIKDFVPNDVAIELKNLGFNEPCMYYWERGVDGHGWGLFSCGELLTCDDLTPEYNDENGNICGEFLAPLWQQAFRWFREKYGYNCFIVSTKDGKWYYYREDLNDRKNDSEPELTPKYDTYEEAELACIKKLIEIVKSGK